MVDVRESEVFIAFGTPVVVVKNIGLPWAGVEAPEFELDAGLRMFSSGALPSRSHRYTMPSSDPLAMREHEGDAKRHRMMFFDVFWCPVYR